MGDSGIPRAPSRASRNHGIHRHHRKRPRRAPPWPLVVRRFCVVCVFCGSARSAAHLRSSAFPLGPVIRGPVPRTQDHGLRVRRARLCAHLPSPACMGSPRVVPQARPARGRLPSPRMTDASGGSAHSNPHRLLPPKPQVPPAGITPERAARRPLSKTSDLPVRRLCEILNKTRTK